MISGKRTFLVELGPSSSKSLHTEDTGGVKNGDKMESEEESTDMPCTKLQNIPEAIRR